jgi:hypothetical protein
LTPHNQNKKNSRTGSWSIHKRTKTIDYYFFVESVVFLVLSIVILDESGVEVLTLSVFTTVVESVVVVEEEPDPQAAKMVTNNTVNNFFILKN